MKNKIKRISKLISSRSFVGSVLLALGLWVYIILNSTKTSIINVPLFINLPSDRAIENEIDKTIPFNVKGTGWQLLNAMYFNTNIKCVIDLSSVFFKDSTYEITREEIRKGLLNNTSLEASEIETSKNITIKTGKVGEYSILVEPNITVNTREGFMLVGDIITKPDLINIRGNDRIVKKIQKWPTQRIVFNDVYEPIFKLVHLSDSIQNIITLSENKVKVIADVQKVAELMIPDVKIKIIGTDVPKDLIIFPNRVNVTIRGGIDQLSTLDPDAISASINSNDLLSDSLGILKLNITIPQYIKILSIDPPFIRHVRRSMVASDKRF